MAACYCHAYLPEFCYCIATCFPFPGVFRQCATKICFLGDTILMCRVARKATAFPPGNDLAEMENHPDPDASYPVIILASVGRSQQQAQM